MGLEERSDDRAAFVRGVADRLMAGLARDAVERFGDGARPLIDAAGAHAGPQADGRGDDVLEVLLPRLVAWMRAMGAAFGRGPVLALASASSGAAMREFGRSVRVESDGSVGDRVARALAPMPPGALALEDLARAEDRVEFRVVRCRYAELAERLGARDLGPALVCGLDFAIAEGMGLRLERSQTLMAEGRPCDFRYSVPGAETRRDG
jgi:hypothetical protein